MEKKRIVIGADIVPTDSNIDLFCNGDMKAVIGVELQKFIGDDSFLICNLETPLTNTASPIIKCGPAFITMEDAVIGLSALGVNLVSLANNHIKDQDSQGIISTCQSLGSVNIDYVGVGENDAAASEPYYFWIMGKMVGVYSCVEHEFSSAAENDYGANTFDPLVSLDQIATMKKKCDYIIVLYHGGKEYYRFPSPDLQRTCRYIIDKGANLVICQHSHCIGSEEEYKGSKIVYGQGNFIFNKKDNEYWNTSLLVCIGEGFRIRYIPIVRTEKGTRMATEEEGNSILSEFKKRSELIKSPEFVKKQYTCFSKSIINNYIIAFNGKKSRFWHLINRLTNGALARLLYRRCYSQRQLAMLKNYIECEAHRELIIEAINALIGSK